MNASSSIRNVKKNLQMNLEAEINLNEKHQQYVSTQPQLSIIQSNTLDDSYTQTSIHQMSHDPPPNINTHHHQMPTKMFFTQLSSPTKVGDQIKASKKNRYQLLSHFTQIRPNVNIAPEIVISRGQQTQFRRKYRKHREKEKDKEKSKDLDYNCSVKKLPKVMMQMTLLNTRKRVQSSYCKNRVPKGSLQIYDSSEIPPQYWEAALLNLKKTKLQINNLQKSKPSTANQQPIGRFSKIENSSPNHNLSQPFRGSIPGELSPQPPGSPEGKKKKNFKSQLSSSQRIKKTLKTCLNIEKKKKYSYLPIPKSFYSKERIPVEVITMPDRNTLFKNDFLKLVVQRRNEENSAIKRKELIKYLNKINFTMGRKGFHPGYRNYDFQSRQPVLELDLSKESRGKEQKEKEKPKIEEEEAHIGNTQNKDHSQPNLILPDFANKPINKIKGCNMSVDALIEKIDKNPNPQEKEKDKKDKFKKMLKNKQLFFTDKEIWNEQKPIEGTYSFSTKNKHPSKPSKSSRLNEIINIDTSPLSSTYHSRANKPFDPYLEKVRKNHTNKHNYFEGLRKGNTQDSINALNLTSQHKKEKRIQFQDSMWCLKKLKA